MSTKVDYYKCPECGGRGADLDCPGCGGSGEDDGLDCQDCQGDGYIEGDFECLDCGHVYDEAEIETHSD